MTMSSQANLNTALASKIVLPFNRPSMTNQAAAGLSSMWRYTTGMPLQGAIPSTAATCTSALAGTWAFPNPTDPVKTYLLGAKFYAFQIPGQFWVMDRLAHMGGLSGTVTTDQTINLSVPASRGATAGDSNLVWFMEIYTDIGTSTQNATLTYVDTGDVTRTITLPVGGSSPANQDCRLFIVPANPGQPIKSITKINLGTTTGTAGSFGFTVGRLLTTFSPQASGGSSFFDHITLNAPRVYDDACLWLVQELNSTSTTAFSGELWLGQV